MAGAPVHNTNTGRAEPGPALGAGRVGHQHKDTNMHMNMHIYLGNLSIEEMEKRTGVVFPEGLKNRLKDTHQDDAQNIQPGKWHCFSIPFMLVCGSREMAQEIFDDLEPLGSKFKEQMQIRVQ